MLMSNFGHKRYQKVTKVLFFANNSVDWTDILGAKQVHPWAILWQISTNLALPLINNLISKACHKRDQNVT